jgi:phosphate/phosphite/phosphonate ABC transporter binding protein
MLIRIIIFFFAISSATAKSQNSDTLVFATYQYADNNRIRNIEPFAKYFGEIIGAPVKVKSYTSVHELINGMNKGETDIVFINTFGYLLLREQSEDYSIAAALQISADARSTYQTAIVSSSNSRINTLNDLVSNAGKFSMLFVNPGSTSGNLIPRLKLAEIGIIEPEKFFTGIAYTKNHALTLKQVIEGKADLGAFGSEEYHRALKNDPTISANVNLLWESASIPLGPVVFNKRLAKAVPVQLMQSLLTLHEKNVNALEAIKSGWTEAIPADKFQVVDDRYYDSILSKNRVEGIKIIKTFAQ